MSLRASDSDPPWSVSFFLHIQLGGEPGGNPGSAGAIKCPDASSEKPHYPPGKEVIGASAVSPKLMQRCAFQCKEDKGDSQCSIFIPATISFF